MLRERLIRREAGEEGFSWRGEEVSRIESFSGAVFAFAVTLLVVSLAICFWLLLAAWFEHYKFFRRYGTSDSYTMRLSAVLLFIVLFYVYFLKFLFVLVAD